MNDGFIYKHVILSTIMIRKEVIEVPVTLLLYVDSFIDGQRIRDRYDAIRKIIAEHKMRTEMLEGKK